MTFVGILLALLAERLIGHLPRVGEPMLLQKLVVGVQRYVPLGPYWRSGASPLILLALACAATGYIDWLLSAPLPNLAFGSVVLFLCLGPRNLASDIHLLLDAHEKNDAAAERMLTLSLLRGPGRQATRRDLVGALFIQSHERLFGVLLWYFAVGPTGAVLYRLASRMPRFLHETQPETAAEQTAVMLHAAAAWLPAHLTAALFGLAGSLDQALMRWRELAASTFGTWRERVWAVLAEVSAASLSVEDDQAHAMVPASLEEALHEVLAIQQRALMILLAAFGLFTAGGWIT